MNTTKLSASEVAARLPAGWSGNDSGIRRRFEFASYEAGVAFAVQIALKAQHDDHHPDSLNIGWKTVQVEYVTHSAGGVTELDVQAAQAVSSLFETQFGPR